MGAKAKTLTLFNAQTITGTATTTSEWVSTGDYSGGDGIYDQSFQHGLYAMQLVASVTGTSPTYTTRLQGSFTKTETDAHYLPNFTGVKATTAMFTAATAAAKEAIQVNGPLPPYIRAEVVSGGVGNSAAVTVKAVAKEG